MHRFFIIYTLLIAAGLGGFLYYAYTSLGEAQWGALASEEGIFERLTAITFGVVAVLAMIIFLKKRYNLWAYFSLLMALACMRELDLHKEWTTDSILKSNFYESPNAPLIEKIIGGAVILLLLFLAFQLIKRVPYWIESLWQFKATAWAVLFGLGSLTVAKCMDSMARWFPFLADFKTENGAFLGVMEEGLEMAGALFFLSIFLMALKRRY